MSTDNGETMPALGNAAGEVKPVGPSIVPTVGRLVLYKPETGDPEHNGAEVLPAVIVRVWSDGLINLRVLNDGAEDFWKTSVKQGEEAGQWDWMPFQKDQQARLAKEEEASKE